MMAVQSDKYKISKSYKESRHTKPKKAAQPCLTAREESNRLYEQHLASRAPPPPADCAICCDMLGFPNFTCPNESCYHRICTRCRDRTLEKDHRCPFCRNQLPGAILDRPMWGRGLEEDVSLTPDGDAETLQGLSNDEFGLMYPGAAVGEPANDNLVGLTTMPTDEIYRSMVGFQIVSAAELWADYVDASIPTQWLAQHEEELVGQMWRIDENRTDYVAQSLLIRWRREQE